MTPMKIDIQHNIGRAKYVVNFSDGTKQHPDGSEFFDIAIFRNKRKMLAFVREIQLRGDAVRGSATLQPAPNR